MVSARSTSQIGVVGSVVALDIMRNSNHLQPSRTHPAGAPWRRLGRSMARTELLRGKVAVVTGGSSGNGRAIALAFGQHGADVVIADIREDPREGGAPTHELVPAETGARANFVRCDVTQVADLEAAVAAAEAFGGIDIMVNNAGILTKQSVLEASEEAFDTMMKVNVRSVYFGTQVAARRMVERGSGSIINLSSIAGMRGNRRLRRLLHLEGSGAPHDLRPGGRARSQRGARQCASPRHHRYPDECRRRSRDRHRSWRGLPADDPAAALGPARRGGRRRGLPGQRAMASYVNGASLVVDGGYLRI